MTRKPVYQTGQQLCQDEKVDRTMSILKSVFLVTATIKRKQFLVYSLLKDGKINKAKENKKSKEARLPV